VKVMSKRGFIKAKAVVTKRLQTLTIDGKQVDTIGIPCHWGFEGATRKGFLANTLTPSVGDANSQTPEYKAFLVNIEKRKEGNSWLCNHKILLNARRRTASRRRPRRGITVQKWQN
jgi:predicted molibdopterin-dependent oxidoreductase YjgC